MRTHSTGQEAEARSCQATRLSLEWNSLSGAQRGSETRFFLGAPYLVNVPDLASQLCLLVVEVRPGERRLVRLGLPLGLGGDGLSAGDGQLHVPDHLLLLLQQLPVPDLGVGAGGREGQRPAPPPPTPLNPDLAGSQRGGRARGQRALKPPPLVRMSWRST
ncbi:unnamed protein product [Gulo gulo]|uniref:Uncharacterized protein n=1 Tax=Gulo gulo TaxID=48420 RepID=A0A9X9PWH5_GULGU|nr:unnamed protein product [Gulo gulo]